jgi:hypothetical protein
MLSEELKPYRSSIKKSLVLRIIGSIFFTIIYNYDFSLLVSIFLGVIAITFTYIITSMIYAFLFAFIKSKKLSYRQRYIRASVKIFLIMTIIEFIGLSTIILFVFLPKWLK